LSRSRSFPCVKHSRAIRCGKYYGPCFGIAGDLAVLNEPFYEPNACYSNGNYSCYKISENNEGINMLTNKKTNEMLNQCKFTIREIEVWGVMFKE
jgi:hypothetical protein